MMLWDMWKKGFERWENTTAQYLETVMKNPAVIGPMGAMLTATMKSKSMTDKAAATLWGSLGLATKRDQERTLHALNQLQSRLLDLEEKLNEQRN